MQLKPYGKYKDSGLDWIGSIPFHWEIKRIKDLFENFSSGTTPKSSNEAYYENGEINWLNTTDLNNSEVYTTKSKVTQAALNECGLKVFPINSLAIAMYGQGKTRGNVGLLKIETTTNQASCIMYNCRGAVEKYVLWWFVQKYEDIRNINVGATQPNMNQDFVKFLALELPPPPEQTAIATYLDRQTALIDQKIALLSQKIDKYQELKKSLINETVCRGLDPTVPMKDSGVEWIGEVPEHWEVKRMKDVGYLYSGLSGKSGKDFNQENNPLNRQFINFTAISNGFYVDTKNVGTVTISNEEYQNQAKKYDLFFLMSSEGYGDIGKSALLIDDIGELYLNSFCKGFRITEKEVSPSFLNYLLSAAAYRNLLIVEGKGFTRINLKIEKITNFEFILPPIVEQISIAQYLHEKTTKIESIVSNLTTQITTLKELRKTLINDVVTGKVKVPMPS